MSKVGLATLFTLVLSGACQTPLVDGGDVVAFTGAVLIDGTGASPRSGTTVVVSGGRITHVVDDGAIRLGAAVDVIVSEGQWLLPGFIDTHAHVLGARTRSARLQALLDHGITSARSPASATEMGIAVRDSIARGDLRGPRFRVAGALLDSPGSRWDFATIVSTPNDARVEVRRQARAGVDFIKLHSRLPPEVVAAAVDEAHRQDLQVIGHLGYTDWHQGLDLGVDALTHSWFSSLASSLVPPAQRSAFADFFPTSDAFDPSLFGPWLELVAGGEEMARSLGQRLADQGVVLDPTLALVEAALRGDDAELYELLVPEENRGDFAPPPHPYSTGWGDEERPHAHRTFAHLLDVVRVFHEEGALITAGTDIGNPWMVPGLSFHRELELLVRAGISNLDVLVVATRNGAQALSWLDEVGTVEVGKRADLVLLSADPLSDIRNTREIVAVYQNGERINSN